MEWLAKVKPGWVAMAPQGDRAHVVSVSRRDGQPPVLRWAGSVAWAHPTLALRALRRSRAMSRQRTVAVLQHGQYQVLIVDAPNLPRDEWSDAIRWQIKEMVNFAVDDAGVDALEIAADPQQRRNPSVLAVAAPSSALAPLISAAADAGWLLQAIDVPETALRNVCALCAGPLRGEALLHVGRAYSTLVITAGGELLASRYIDMTVERLSGPDEAVRMQHFERTGLDLQRTFDTIESQFAHADVARLQVAPGPPLQGFIAYINGLVAMPVVGFDFGAALDCSAVPALNDPAVQADFLPAIGAALR